jgi:hypothetical protein
MKAIQMTAVAGTVVPFGHAAGDPPPEAARAHARIEQQQTVGTVILVP